MMENTFHTSSFQGDIMPQFILEQAVSRIFYIYCDYMAAVI